jgi:hypothetical protein
VNLFEFGVAEGLILVEMAHKIVMQLAESALIMMSGGWNLRMMKISKNCKSLFAESWMNIS